ncbi:L-threonylcarbamoyladenylate synthase [Candidatus Lokiarchaeum ossiferum]|uniref:L-threonylcarbamoyladenylate synthase n=1 Tax=Candidatus Lokiarchaeum ossiferum TaxID=2951803 RepID=UPI00352F3243
METKIISLDPTGFTRLDLEEAVYLMQNGEIIGFPTETVYGLGASILNPESLKKIYLAKGRPMDNPLIVHISHMDMLPALVKQIPERISILCDRYWPGPLTILFEKSELVSDLVTAGLSTVAIRMPANEIARALIRELGEPIAAPSANSSGKPSPTTAMHVFNDLKGIIPLILDGGSCDYGVESTVIDVHSNPPLILRPGGITLEELQEVLPNIQVYGKNQKDKALEEKPSTPGLKYTHYSPNAPVILLTGTNEEIQAKLQKTYLQYKENQSKIGIIHTHKTIELPILISQDQDTYVHSLGINKNELIDSQDFNAALIQQGLFAKLREMDMENVDVIIVEAISEKKEGLAVMNRLQKAAFKIL